MMKTCRRRRASRGLTVLEMLIATAVLALLILAVGSATIPLQRQASDSVLHLDQEQRARRILDGLRREVRQSGWNSDVAAAPMFALYPEGRPAGLAAITSRLPLLDLRFRTGLGAADWSEPVRFSVVRDGEFSGVPVPTPRFVLVREADYDGDGAVEPNEALQIAGGISDLQLRQPPGGKWLEVALELTDPDPRWSGTRAGAPQPLRRTFLDRVEMRNGPRE